MAKKNKRPQVQRSENARRVRGGKGVANVLEEVATAQLQTKFPDFKAGDRIVVNSRIKEGDKERIQAFEGVVIARKGRGIKESFTVRKVSAGVGVERVFPVHSNRIESVEVKSEGFVRRAKIYYLRELEGRKARIQDKNLKLQQAQGAKLAGSSN